MLNTYFTNRSTHSNIFFPEMARSVLYTVLPEFVCSKNGDNSEEKKLPEIAYTKINVAGKRKLPHQCFTPCQLFEERKTKRKTFDCRLFSCLVNLVDLTPTFSLS